MRALTPSGPARRRLHVQELEDRTAPAGDVTDFRMLALVYTNVQLPLTSATMDPATVEAVTEGAQLEFPRMIRQLAGDQLDVRVHVEVVDRPFDGLFWDGSRYQWVTDIGPELDAFTRSGWYDHITVFHPLTNSLGPSAWWGGGGLQRYGMSVGSIAISRPQGRLGDHDVPGFIHEWIHGLEVQYFYYGGVPQGTDPTGQPLDLHDAGAFGYTDITEGRPGWSRWYGDFLTDHIRNRHSTGADTGLGLGPDAWARGAPHEAYPYTPGAPLERPDVSNKAPSFLSDVYWPRADSAAGPVRRDATVGGNPIAINGQAYAKGVGIPANGTIRVNPAGRAARFVADVGIGDDVGAAGSAVFRVYGDGQLLSETGPLTGADGPVRLDLDVTGIQQVRLEVDDAGDGPAGDHAVWAGAHFVPFRGDYASDLPWSASATGWGAIHLDRTVDRNPIVLNGRYYGKGIGTHASSDITIPLGGRYEVFRSDVGIPDEINFWGTVEFRVYADGELRYASPTMYPADLALPVELDVTGVQELRLVVTDGFDGINSDHAVWAGAHLVNLPPTVGLSGAASVAEGDPYALDLGPVGNEGSVPVTGYTVHWGDGTSEPFTGSPAGHSRTHTYLAGGRDYTIAVDLTDADGTHPAAGSRTVTVRNARPTISLGGAAAVDEGAAHTLELGAVTGPVSGYTIHWGDGTSETFDGNPAHTTRTHTYADGANDYTIRVDLRDPAGTHPDTGSKAVTVRNVAPAVALGGAATVDEAAAYTLTLGAVTDPGTDSVTGYTVHWGDGTSESFAGSPANVTRTHTYAAGGTSYTITVDLTDEDGTHPAAGSATVFVANVPATVRVDQAGGQAEPVAVGPIYFDVVFREDVTGFDGDDVRFDGSTVGGTLAATVVPVTGSVYQVEVRGMFGAGTVVASIPAGAATDAAGLPSAASTSADNEVAYNGYGTIAFTSAAFGAAEADGVAAITVTRLGGTDGDVEVAFETADGTAVPGLDYDATQDSHAWTSGQGGDWTFTVPLEDDERNEGTETVGLRLRVLSGQAAAGPPAVLAIAPSDGTEIKAAAARPEKPFATFADDDGDVATVRLAGRVGTATVYRTDTDGDGVGPIELIELKDTDPARSVLGVTVRRARTTSDRGWAAVGEVRGSGLKLLNLPRVDLNGPGIALTGHLGALVVGAVSKGADITAAGEAAQRTRIRIGPIGDGTVISIGSGLARFTAGPVGVAEVRAPSIGVMTVRGPFRGRVVVGGTGMAAGRPALGALTVFGVADGAAIEVVGDVGTVAARSFVNSHLFAGYAGPPDGTGTFTRPATVRVFRTTAPEDSFRNSSVVGSVVNAVSLASVVGANGGNDFGVFAGTRIGTVTVRTPKRRFDNPTAPDGFGDFVVAVVPAPGP